MGVAARVTRLGRRLVAATHELAQGINERRFLAHLALADLLSRDPYLRECATPVDHLRQLVENAYHATLQPSLSLPIWKSLQASPSPGTVFVSRSNGRQIDVIARTTRLAGSCAANLRMPSVES